MMSLLQRPNRPLVVTSQLSSILSLTAAWNDELIAAAKSAVRRDYTVWYVRITAKTAAKTYFLHCGTKMRLSTAVFAAAQLFGGLPSSVTA
jgi:hypothetical protein